MCSTEKRPDSRYARRPVDIELLGSPRVVAARLTLHPVTDRRSHFGVVDEAQTLVALANPLTQEGEEQPVPLSWALSRERTCAFPAVSHPTPGYPCSRSWRSPISRRIRLYADGKIPSSSGLGDPDAGSSCGSATCWATCWLLCSSSQDGVMDVSHP